MSPSLLEFVFLVLQLVLLSLEEFAKILFYERWVAFVHCFFDESLERVNGQNILTLCKSSAKKVRGSGFGA